ncbi:HisA/HisF-related TIM barrel protein [Actinosynnema sp. NPDC047251]|uniref:Imidazole glycerol phosphate synthase subunit HisF n=1 Tax=Saccharothrix espanaensis (strain ATCC 51144 / DSM 44229 / JCM 9112 / NBRC 15066 / NRRL 15764) TaxID=1179773 RepID=K0K4V1_SACES|nr:HisA/HisF-related TIM barrel protein [Saccharothrix espanaensis]CCH32597.1 Imidazole glycerol phosphate synthase subunit HisF [Saccharothrix espanaensis DSM 44229]
MPVTDPPTLVDVLIPCVDVSDERSTEASGVPGLRDRWDPVELIAHYAGAGVRRVLVDVVDTWERVGEAQRVVAGAAPLVEVMVSLHDGRVPSVEDCAKLLDAGAASVSVSTSAVDDPDTVSAIAARFGSDRLVGVVNARYRRGGQDGWTVYVDGGDEATGIDALTFGRTLRDLGCGAVIANCADREGTGRGFDHALTRALVEALSIPVIASGGARTVRDLHQGITEGGASYVLANKMLHSGAVTLDDIRRNPPPDGR